jgi:acetate kinase
MSRDRILTFNAGSSSIKIGIFSVDKGKAVRRAKALLDLQASPLALQLSAGEDVEDIALDSPASEDLHDVLDETLAILASHHGLDRVVLAGHRVVHGGDRFVGPIEITPEALDGLAALVPFAPLHQSQSLRIIRAVQRLRPHVRQTASFDTAFHAGQSDAIRRFPLPRRLFDQGVKRYGFHGLSYKFIAGALEAHHPDVAKGRVVVAHLGNGASLCALHGGRSIETTMGFSPLDGVPMGTRPGTLDPGVVLHLVRTGGGSLEKVEDMLYHHGGLLAMSGLSADTRVLLASDDDAAHEALAIFTHRIAQSIAALGTTLGGLDAVVFTGGIGEHQPPVRKEICGHLEWLGLTLDADANDGNRTRIHHETSTTDVLVIPTDEEQVIADEGLAALV